MNGKFVLFRMRESFEQCFLAKCVFETPELRAILWAKQSITCTTMSCFFFLKNMLAIRAIT
jgi:hypothetical protein